MRSGLSTRFRESFPSNFNVDVVFKVNVILNNEDVQISLQEQAAQIYDEEKYPVSYPHAEVEMVIPSFNMEKERIVVKHWKMN